MAGLRDLNSKLDYYWNEYSRKFPGLFFNDENGKPVKPLIIPGQSLRKDAPMYFKRYIDEDPTSYYLFIQADPMQGPSDRDTAVEFFFDFFHEKLGQRSSYEDEGYDPYAAADMEVLPAPNDNLYKRYYDEQMRQMQAHADAEEQEERNQAFRDKFGFDRNDPDIIDVVDDDAAPAGNAGNGIQARDANATALALPKKIFYAIDFHVPAGMELGYDGRGANRMGGRRQGRLGRGDFGRLGFGESEKAVDEGIFDMFKGKKPLTVKEFGKKIKALLDSGKANDDSKISGQCGPDTYFLGTFETRDAKKTFVMGIGLESKVPQQHRVNVKDMVSFMRGHLGVRSFSEFTSMIVGDMYRYGHEFDVMDVVEKDGDIQMILVENASGNKESNDGRKSKTSDFFESEDELGEGNVLDKTWNDALDKNRDDELKDDAKGKSPDEQDEETEEAVADELDKIRGLDVNESIPMSTIAGWNRLIKE